MTQLLLLYLDVQRSRLDPLGDLSLQFYMSDCAPSLWTSGDDVSRFTTDNLPSQITSFDFQFSLLHSEVFCSLLAPTIGGAKARSSAYPLDYFKGLADLDNLRDALVDASQTFAAFMDNPLSVPGARGLVAHSAFYSSLSTNGVQRFWLRDFGAPRSYVDVDDQGYSTALLFSSLGLRGKKTTLHCTLCISDARRVPHVAAVLMTASELAGAVTERPDLGLSHITIDVRQQNTSVNKPVYEVFIRTYQDLLTGASAWPHELLSAPCLD